MIRFARYRVQQSLDEIEHLRIPQILSWNNKLNGLLMKYMSTVCVQRGPLAFIGHLRRKKAIHERHIIH